MQTLISAVGTRGDVQPAMALATELRELGCHVRLCVPPNFTIWAAELGFVATSIGVEMRAPARGAPPPKPASVPDLITNQFDVVSSAAEGCDLIVGAGNHQYAARSIAELRGIGYVDAVYAPVSLPSTDLAPPGPQAGSEGGASSSAWWDDYKRRWNERALERVNFNRARLGLGQVEDVLGHILTDHPWLAADATLGPAPSTPGLNVFQTGAWILKEATPLPASLESFLQAGDPPIYLGLGSMPAAESTSRTVLVH